MSVCVAVKERFRRLVIACLQLAECLSDAFAEVLLGWEHSGFSLHAIEPSEARAVERVRRYLTRAPVALGKVHPQGDGRIKLLTPRDPTTGPDHRLFDPRDWVHMVTTPIHDPHQHEVRYYGVCGSRPGLA